MKKILVTALLGLTAVTGLAVSSAPAAVPTAGVLCHQCPDW